MRRPPIAGLLALAAMVALPGAAAAAARPGSLAGTFPVPRGGQGELRVVDAATGGVAATRTLPRSGAFRLTLPAGAYLLVGAAVTRRGRATTTATLPVTLRVGQRRKKLPLRRSTRKAERRARRAFVQERGQVTAGSVAVEIPSFTGATGDLSVFNRGMAAMLITDVTNGADECGVTVREVDRIADVIAELELSRSPYVDPSTRVERNFIVSDVAVRGRLETQAGGSRLGYDVRIVDTRTGETLSRIQGTMATDDVFAGEQALAGKLNDELCKLSDVYEVTLDLTGSGTFATHLAGGRIQATLRATRPNRRARVWTGEGQLAWSELNFVSKIPDCSYTDPVGPVVPWTVKLTDTGNGQLNVEWRPSTNDMATATVRCDKSAVGGQPGPGIVDTRPTEFAVPHAGGRQPLAGGYTAGGDGWQNSGSITITPKGVTRVGS